MLQSRGVDTQVFYAEISFESIVDERTRLLFNELPTSLTLKPEQVQQLIDGGRLLLRADQDYQAFLAHTQGERTPGAISNEAICQRFGGKCPGMD